MSDRTRVYVSLPGEAAAVLAGQIIGVREGAAKWCRFKYATDYLDRREAFPFDPDLLPLDAGVKESELDFELFNVFRDSSPDHWGRRVIERNLGRGGLSEIEFLLHAGTHRVGALHYGVEEAPSGQEPVAFGALSDLIDAAEALERGEPIDPEAMALLGHGSGTLGGMRPKATVELDGVLWIAKFPSATDRIDLIRMENAALRLAKNAGVAVTTTQLHEVGGRPVLLARRFDRRPLEDGWERLHYLSGLTLTGLHERDYHRGSYAGLGDWLRRHGVRPDRDLPEIFRRMLFSILIGNTDDHLRNHAVIRDANGYRLSPAFDLVPQQQATGERHQAIEVGPAGRIATTENALSGAGRLGLTEAEAGSICTEVRDVVEGWREIFLDAGVEGPALTACEHAIDPGR